MVGTGLVAQRIAQIDGDEGAARIDRRALNIKEEKAETKPPSISTVILKSTNTSAQKPLQTGESATQAIVEETSTLLMTPRGDAQRPASVSARRKSALRHSLGGDRAAHKTRVSFAQEYGLDVQAESEDDFGLGDNIPNPLNDSAADTFAMDDSDEGEWDDVDDDEYDFDHEKLAGLVKAGADRNQLVAHVEEAMAAALERKLKRKAGTEPRDIKTLAAAAASQRETEWDLDGRMTPPEGQQAAPVDVNDVATRANEAIALAQARRRRSSVSKKYATGIELAMEQAKERRRQSLARKYGTQENAQTMVQQAMEQARGRHRKSMSKAAEVLECAGYDDEQVDGDEAWNKMRLVQQAMEDARQRHRRSIAHAVQDLQEPRASTFNADAQAFAAPQYCDQLQDVSSWPNTEHSWCNDTSNTWHCPSSSAQDRISQAVSSAYESHYSEQAFHDQGLSTSGYDSPGTNGQWCQNASGYDGQTYDQPAAAHGHCNGQLANNDYQQYAQHTSAEYGNQECNFHCDGQFGNNGYQANQFDHAQNASQSLNYQQNSAPCVDQSYTYQCNGQFATTAYQPERQHAATKYQCDGQFGNYDYQQVSDSQNQSWQQHDGGDVWAYNAQKVGDGWGNQQVYKAPWTLGSA